MAARGSPPSPRLWSPCTAPSTRSGGWSSSTCALRQLHADERPEAEVRRARRRGRNPEDQATAKAHRHGRDLRPPPAQEPCAGARVRPSLRGPLPAAAARLRPTTRYTRSRRTSRESDPCAPTSWRSRTSPDPSLRCRIPPGSGASARRSASSAGACGASSACDAHVVPLRLTDTCHGAQSASLAARRRSASALSLAVTTSSPAAALAGYPVTAVR